jgi:CheY-like chemotaxis protein
MVQVSAEAGGVPRPTAPPSKARINLERASVLLIDNSLGLEILSHIFHGFGTRALHRCSSVGEALEVVATTALDLIVTEALLVDRDGYDFVQAVRQLGEQDPNRFTPIIVLSAHTAASKVGKARDCGANFFVAKPISPQVIMDRLIWVAKENRQFLQTDTYSGPDRRFQEGGPPQGVQGRRRSDPPEAAQSTFEPVS